jgi:hypothetical protein
VHFLINPLKSKRVKNSVRSSKGTPNFTITKIKLLMLFKVNNSVYAEKQANPQNTELLTVKAGATIVTTEI